MDQIYLHYFCAIKSSPPMCEVEKGNNLEAKPAWFIVIICSVADSWYPIRPLRPITTIQQFKAGSSTSSLSDAAQHQQERGAISSRHHLLLLHPPSLHQVQHPAGPDRQHGGQHALDQHQEGALQVCYLYKSPADNHHCGSFKQT